MTLMCAGGRRARVINLVGRLSAMLPFPYCPVRFLWAAFSRTESRGYRLHLFAEKGPEVGVTRVFGTPNPDIRLDPKYEAPR